MLTPLATHTTLIAHNFREPNRRSQTQFAPDLVRLVRFFRTFLQWDQNGGEDLKANIALQCNQKAKKNGILSNFTKVEDNSCALLIRRSH
jgi:hypothetical protein